MPEDDRLQALFEPAQDEDAMRSAILEQVSSRTFRGTIETLVVEEVRGTLSHRRAQFEMSYARSFPDDHELQELYAGWSGRREREFTAVFTRVLTGYEIGSESPGAEDAEELARIFCALLEGGAVVRAVDEDLAERAAVTLIRQQLQAALARVVGRPWADLAGLRAGS